MTEKLQVWKCELCGNIVESIHGGKGQLVCCGAPMILKEEKTADRATEKHVPVIEKTDDGFLVKVGSVPHPMMEKHFIEWIEVIAGGKAYMEYLKPGDKPEALFCVDADEITAREYCNIHGLWKGD
ncbi:MAG: desulfoferrodoxin [Candidatus Eremiobacteraeota bacterium]|nr:desulfoferrodoxin [Candidatus Eremiobacteraeota bacterium]